MDGAQAHVLVRVEHMRPVNDMPYAASYASAGVGDGWSWNSRISILMNLLIISR